MKFMYWHTKGIDSIYSEINSSKTGLTDHESSKRLDKYGKNKLVKKQKFTAIKIFINQFKSFLVVLLTLAVIVSYYLGEIIDAYVIGIIIILNALLGFVQEYKAERAIESLKKLSTTNAKVLRDGKEELINAEELVPGDIILLEEGDKVPADARLVEVINLEIDESTLTGESTPVSKDRLPEVLALIITVAFPEFEPAPCLETTISSLPSPLISELNCKGDKSKIILTIKIISSIFKSSS